MRCPTSSQRHRDPAEVAGTPLFVGLFALAGCGSDSPPANSSASAPTMAGAEHQPVTTSADDWKPVADTLGRPGTLSDDKTVYRVPLPRTDLHVVTDDVKVKPGLSPGGYAAAISSSPRPNSSRSPTPCRHTESTRPRCTSTCSSRPRRCGGPTQWATPPRSPPVPAQRSMRSTRNQPSDRSQADGREGGAHRRPVHIVRQSRLTTWFLRHRMASRDVSPSAILGWWWTYPTTPLRHTSRKPPARSSPRQARPVYGPADVTQAALSVAARELVVIPGVARP